MRLGDLISIVLRNIRQRRFRSWLTVLGILIGVAALVALVSVTEGIEAAIVQELTVTGSDTISIIPERVETGGRFGEFPMEGVTKLTERDVKEISRIPGVEVISPRLGSLIVRGEEVITTAEYRGERAKVSTIGVDPKAQEAIEVAGIVEGRYLIPSDRHAAVLGWDIAKGTFDEDVKVRKTIKINGEEFRVVGILEKTGGGFGTADKAIFIPLRMAREIFRGFGEDEFSTIVVKTSPGADVEEVASEIEARLLKLHGLKKEEADFTVVTQELIGRMVGNIMGIITLAIGGIASIALVVGGIGIMNTMVVSVMERTREIGIMKAVGATDRSVMGLFIAESGLMGLAGGALGVALGTGLSKMVGMAGYFFMGEPFPTIVTLKLVAAGLVFALVVGILSGYYPARKAAKMDPVDALRYE